MHDSIDFSPEGSDSRVAVMPRTSRRSFLGMLGIGAAAAAALTVVRPQTAEATDYSGVKVRRSASKSGSNDGRVILYGAGFDEHPGNHLELGRGQLVNLTVDSLYVADVLLIGKRWRSWNAKKRRYNSWHSTGKSRRVVRNVMRTWGGSITLQVDK